MLALLGLAASFGLLMAQDAAPAEPAEAAPAVSEEQKEVEDIQASGEKFVYPYFNPKDADPFFEKEQPPPGNLKGLERFDVAECKLQGIAKTQIGDVALYRGRDGRAYVAKVGQNFKNGLIISINPAKSEVVVRVELKDDLQVRPFEDKSFFVKNPAPQGTGFQVGVR